MNNSRQLLSLARLCQRQATRSASAEAIAAKAKKLKEAQKHFGIDDGIPVYMKGGFTDRVFAGATTLLIAVGLVMSAEVGWKLTFKDA